MKLLYRLQFRSYACVASLRFYCNPKRGMYNRHAIRLCDSFFTERSTLLSKCLSQHFDYFFCCTCFTHSWKNIFDASLMCFFLRVCHCICCKTDVVSKFACGSCSSFHTDACRNSCNNDPCYISFL